MNVALVEGKTTKKMFCSADSIVYTRMGNVDCGPI